MTVPYVFSGKSKLRRRRRAVTRMTAQPPKTRKSKIKTGEQNRPGSLETRECRRHFDGFEYKKKNRNHTGIKMAFFLLLLTTGLNVFQGRVGNIFWVIVSQKAWS